MEVLIMYLLATNVDTKELSRNNFHLSRGATRLAAKAQTVGPLRAAGSVLKCGNYLKTTPKGLKYAGQWS